MPDSETPPLGALGEFQEMRAAAFVLPGDDTAIAGQAKALIDWHRRHRLLPQLRHATTFGDRRRVSPRLRRNAAPSIFPAPIRW